MVMGGSNNKVERGITNSWSEGQNKHFWNTVMRPVQKGQETWKIISAIIKFFLYFIHDYVRKNFQHTLVNKTLQVRT